MAYVSRDPFARQEIHKTREHGGACTWCCVRDQPASGAYVEGHVYRYRVESDGGRKTEDRHTFCSLSCRRAYYGR